MSLTIVSEQLLTANNLNHQDLYAVLTAMSERRLDYADLYFQSSYHEVWALEDRMIKEASYNIDQGLGVRAIVGDKTGFAYADQISLDALHQSATAAKGISKEAGAGQSHIWSENSTTPFYATIDPLQTFPRDEKIALLKDIDRFTRTIDPRVIEVRASFSSVYEQILVAATDGTLAADIRPLVRFSISVLVEENGRREGGSSGGGGRYGYDAFIQTNPINGETLLQGYAREAVRMALVNLTAIAAPAGSFAVVLGAGWPGVLLHEAVGHGLEGDFNRKATSVFHGKIGQLVTSELCTIVDDATMPGRRGSLTIDDEGVPGQYNVLVENGILKGYMQDKLNARLMGVEPTGNGRRESYASLPMPRMTNTYLLPGSASAAEIIDSVEYGVYAPNFAGGQVDITSGKFVFSASEAYLIEKGRITNAIKGATLIGSGIEAMQKISMVGNDLKIDPGIGVCGKDGQSVPVGVGQPTLKVDNLTVGGTA